MQEHFEEVARDTRLGKVTTNWSSKEKEALAELHRAAGAFFKARSENEVEVETIHAGAGCDAEVTQINARAALEDAFVAALERFEQGQLPKFSAAQFKQADAQLNSLDKTILSTVDVHDENEAPSHITGAGIRTAQRSWLHYREAWVVFGRLKYPSVAADSWRTWLTQERVKMLKVW